MALIRAGETVEGAERLRSALERHPGDLILRTDYALALAEAGEADQAVVTLAEGARFHPGSPDLASQLARLLTRLGRHDDAQRVLVAALTARPDNLELRGLLAAEFAAALDFAPARRQLTILLVLLPDQAPVYANLAVVVQSAGDAAASIPLYRRSVAIDANNPVAQVNLATALFTEGEYGEGFAHYEHRRVLPDMPLPPADVQPWRGEPPAGRRFLVTVEQGYGDILQFARFLPLFAERGAEIWLECPNEMARLLAALPGLRGLAQPGEAPPAVDFTLPLLSLPYRLGTGADLRGEAIPYLKAPADGPRLPAAAGRRIGLVWAGRPAKGELFIRRTLERRACPLAALGPLWSAPGIAWYSLQHGPARDQLARTGAPLIDLAPLIGDFADSAGLMDQLDLVISVDTASAHLAGALGRPLWVMLAPGQADYRWGGTGGISPWYPKARLFRAERQGWEELAGRIAAALSS